ncbi:MAG: (2Fe-2S) ferredoxin domain-containing protein [Armatimonadetes bacterium]|nr:(2Fe-2S) ferredoxin domain-containing protein [Armatimonadota bacterium]
MSALTILNEMKEKASLERKEAEAGVTTYLVVGMATCGVAAGAGDTYAALAEMVAERGLKEVRVLRTGCVGRCDMEPMVQIVRDGEAPVMYCRVTPEVAKRIVERHLEKNEILLDWVLI